MNISGNTILITGGGTGIGLALAELFLAKDNKVIVCGRRKSKLLEAKKKFPEINIKTCDITKAAGRKDFFSWISSHFSSINILVNNAGIQKMIDFKKGSKGLASKENEITTNFDAPVKLCALFIPHLMKQKESAIINISSGLGFVPLAAVPVYCATKAALHSFSLSLRYQLKDTSIKVFEIIPPMVDTELDQGSREKKGQNDRGIPARDVAVATVTAIENNDYETAVGMAEDLRNGARETPEQIFNMMNN